MITGGSGTISSPRYPSNYPDNSLCTWIILAPPGQRISLRFESFDLEDYVDCQYDYLQLKNGGSSSSPAIGKYCGRTNPPSVVSSSNSIWLEMKTDCKTSQSGFRLSWQVVTAQGPDGGRLTTEAAKTTSPVQTKTSTTQKTYEPITREPPTREPPTREPSTREPLTREPLTREPPRPTTTIPLPGTGKSKFFPAQPGFAVLCSTLPRLP